MCFLACCVCLTCLTRNLSQFASCSTAFSSPKFEWWSAESFNGALSAVAKFIYARDGGTIIGLRRFDFLCTILRPFYAFFWCLKFLTDEPSIPTVPQVRQLGTRATNRYLHVMCMSYARARAISAIADSVHTSHAPHSRRCQLKMFSPNNGQSNHRNDLQETLMEFPWQKFLKAPGKLNLDRRNDRPAAVMGSPR